MNKKRVIVTSIILVILLGLGWGIYYFFNVQDEKSTLTILEKKWIEKNKNNVVDIGLINNIPIFNFDGNGLLFDFIKEIEKNTGLEFNKISYNLGELKTPEYSFNIVDNVKDNDILIYEDNYVIVSNSNKKFANLEEIPNIILGVKTKDLEVINFYLYDNKNISYKTFNNDEELLAEINSQNSSVNAIVIPKTIYMKQIIEQKLNINYNISDAKKNLVLTLGNEKKLNTIIKKYYEKWKEEKYDSSFGENFSENYFAFNNIYENNIANFRSKRYNFGYISYAPYTTLVDGKLVGINNEELKEFADLADVEIKTNEYRSFHDLIKDFNQNKIDLFYNITNESKYDMDIYNTISPGEEKIVIIAKENNKIQIKSLSSLKGEDVYTIAGSKISKYLKGYGIVTNEVNNFDNILNKVKNDIIIAMDEKAFDIYRHNKLEKYKIYYTFNLGSNYNYTIRDIKDNKVFSNFFNFYLSFVNNDQISNNVTSDQYVINVKSHLIRYLIISIITLFIIIMVIYLIAKKPFKRHGKNSFNKDNNIKYIDMLTSLKNRNYLNDTIEIWDDSEIYPQVIIVIDLNNIAYINDNYGHEEGDNVIKQAANILITNQVENSEIMRTNGNEFLIYMVEYDEKQVVTYIRKLSKDFKEINHGFGAAIGYSMITDGLKTIDDAINEATLDMKSNKEEINN